MPAAQTTMSTPPQRLTRRSKAAATECSLVTSMRTARARRGSANWRQPAPRRLVDIAEGHRRSRFDQPQRYAATQPRSGSSDQGHAAGQRRLRVAVSLAR